MSTRHATIISTGRTGSTALDRVLTQHPEIIVIPELLEPALPNAILDATTEIDGKAFLALLDAPTMEGRQRAWREKGPTAEVLDLPENAPWSLLRVYCLPAITVQGRGLSIRAVTKEVCSWKLAFAKDHLRRLFDWIASLAKRPVWVERTGGSSFVVDDVLRAFPDARIVHLVRWGPDVAMSMASHSVFQEILSKTRAAPLPFPPEAFAHFWCEGVLKTLAALRHLPAGQVHTAYYETLCGPQKVGELAQLASHCCGRSKPSKADLEWASRIAPEMRQNKKVIESELHTKLIGAAKNALLGLGYDLPGGAP